MSAAKRCTLGILLAVCATGGCASWPKPRVPDVKPQRQQRADEAIREFEQRRDDAQHQAAVQLWKQGDRASSTSQLEKLVARNPDHEAARRTLIEQLISMGKTAEAVTQAADAAKRFPNNAQILHVAGVAYEMAGDGDQAASCFQRVIELETSEPASRSASKDSPNPTVFAGKTVAMQTLSSKALVGKKLHVDKSDQPAAPSEKPHTAGPEKPPAKTIAPAALPVPVPRLHLGQSPDPVEVNVDAQLLMAEICLALSRPEEAQTHLAAIVKDHPDHAEAKQMLARVRETSGTAVEALVDVQPATEFDASGEMRTVGRDADDSVRPVHRVGAVVRFVNRSRSIEPPRRVKKQEQQDEIDVEPRRIDVDSPVGAPRTLTVSSSAARPIVQPLDEAIETPAVEMPADAQAQPAPRAGVQAKVSPYEHLHRGTTALAAGAPHSAQSYFQRALQAAPGDEKLALSIAVLALRHDQPELAIELATQALEHHPRSAALYRVVGTAQYRLDHWKAAQVALQQAIHLDNAQALSYFLMGCTLSKLGQPDAADWNYRQARQLDARYALKP
jgi:tetratricopeptide (TPR) repeat protein